MGHSSPTTSLVLSILMLIPDLGLLLSCRKSGRSLSWDESEGTANARVPLPVFNNISLRTCSLAILTVGMSRVPSFFSQM